MELFVRHFEGGLQTPLIRDTATMPLALGGMVLRSASWTRTSAFWASSADSLAMIHACHREVASQLWRMILEVHVCPLLHKPEEP